MCVFPRGSRLARSLAAWALSWPLTAVCVKSNGSGKGSPPSPSTAATGPDDLFQPGNTFQRQTSPGESSSCSAPATLRTAEDANTHQHAPLLKTALQPMQFSSAPTKLSRQEAARGSVQFSDILGPDILGRLDDLVLDDVAKPPFLPPEQPQQEPDAGRAPLLAAADVRPTWGSEVVEPGSSPRVSRIYASNGTTLSSPALVEPSSRPPSASSRPNNWVSHSSFRVSSSSSASPCHTGSSVDGSPVAGGKAGSDAPSAQRRGSNIVARGAAPSAGEGERQPRQSCERPGSSGSIDSTRAVFMSQIISRVQQEYDPFALPGSGSGDEGSSDRSSFGEVIKDGEREGNPFAVPGSGRASVSGGGKQRTRTTDDIGTSGRGEHGFALGGSCKNGDNDMRSPYCLRSGQRGQGARSSAGKNWYPRRGSLAASATATQEAAASAAQADLELERASFETQLGADLWKQTMTTGSLPPFSFTEPDVHTPPKQTGGSRTQGTLPRLCGLTPARLRGSSAASVASRLSSEPADSECLPGTPAGVLALSSGVSVKSTAATIGVGNCWSSRDRARRLFHQPMTEPALPELGEWDKDDFLQERGFDTGDLSASAASPAPEARSRCLSAGPLQGTLRRPSVSVVQSQHTPRRGNFCADLQAPQYDPRCYPRRAAAFVKHRSSVLQGGERLFGTQSAPDTSDRRPRALRPLRDRASPHTRRLTRYDDSDEEVAADDRDNQEIVGETERGGGRQMTTDSFEVAVRELYGNEDDVDDAQGRAVGDIEDVPGVEGRSAGEDDAGGAGRSRKGPRQSITVAEVRAPAGGPPQVDGRTSGLPENNLIAIRRHIWRTSRLRGIGRDQAASSNADEEGQRENEDNAEETGVMAAK